ncbi:hypothetical protein SBBP1_630003 [Burkholderiales bacterium]|nr:hypothetical protein SBBP1_630003 [Burkholderiales bacterium]
MSSTLPANDPDHPDIDLERRAAIVATGVVGGAGCVAAALPYIASWGPSEREKAAGSPVDVDVSSLAPGKMLVAEWRGKPIWILRRTPEMIKTLRSDTNRLFQAHGFSDSGLRPHGPGAALDQARTAGAHRHLHPPGMFAQRAICQRRKFAAGGRSRIRLSLPWFDV